MEKEGCFKGPPAGVEPEEKLEIEAGLESPELGLSLLDHAEQEIDAVAAQELGGNEEITRRLLALGATKEGVPQVLHKTKTVDREIENVRESTVTTLFEALNNFYREKVKHLDKSILSEFTIRPIHRKCKSLNNEVRRQNKTLTRLEGNLDESVTVLSEFPDLIAGHGLTKTIIADTKNYIENTPYRRFERTLRIEDVQWNQMTEEAADMRVLHALLLHEMKTYGQDPKKLQESMDVYFEPSPIMYIDSHRHKVFSEESGDPRNNYVLLSVLQRMRAFNHHILQNETVSSKIPKTMLQSKILDIFENERNIKDIFQHHQDLQDIRFFIDSAGFDDEQKRLIYKRLFSSMASHPDALLFFSDNLDFPYTEEYKHILIDLLDKSCLDDTKYLQLVNQKKIFSSPELRAKVSQVTLEKLSSTFAEYAARGSYQAALHFTKNMMPLFIEAAQLNGKQQEMLNQRAEQAILLAVETFLDIYTAKERFDINQLTHLMEDVTKLPAQQSAVIQEKIDRIPWSQDIAKILSMYGHSRRQEFDQWQTDIGPLAATMVREGILSNDQKKDGHLFLEYIKKVGPINLPKYFGLFTDIKRNASVADMPSELKTKIKVSFGIDGRCVV